MEGLTITDNEENMVVVASLQLEALINSDWNSFVDNTKPLPTAIAYEVREKFVPVHKRKHPLNHLTSFIRSCLGELREEIVGSETILLTFNPTIGAIEITFDIIVDGLSKGRPKTYKRPSPLIQVLEVCEDEDDDENAKTKKVKKFISREEFLLVRAKIKQVMTDFKITQRSIARHFDWSDRVVHGTINRPYSKTQLLPKKLAFIHDYLVEYEKNSMKLD